MNEYLLAENEALFAAWDVVHPLVQAALPYGPLPSYKTSAFLDANPGQRLAVIALLGHAYLLADPDQRVREKLRQVSNDVHGAGGADLWRDLANRRTRAEVLAERAKAVTMLRCTVPGCGSRPFPVLHPLPGLEAVRCTRHRDEEATAA